MPQSLSDYEKIFFEADPGESLSDAKHRQFADLVTLTEYNFYKDLYDNGKDSGDIDAFLT